MAYLSILFIVCFVVFKFYILIKSSLLVCSFMAGALYITINKFLHTLSTWGHEEILLCFFLKVCPALQYKSNAHGIYLCGYEIENNFPCE